MPSQALREESPATSELDDIDETSAPSLTFSELGVPGPLVKVLRDDNKTTAFPIQADTLPDSLNGRDILGRGKTGSGKTLAFAIPMVTCLMDIDAGEQYSAKQFRKAVEKSRHAKAIERRADNYKPHPRGLILAPTRELANQINDVIMPLANMVGMDTTTIYGGVRYSRQIHDLNAGAEIVVACPGRLEDLIEQGYLTLDDVQVVVLDEADEMADMGFLPPVKRILEQIDKRAQHMLFSATLDHGVAEIVNEFLDDPKVHSVDDAMSHADAMTFHLFMTNRSQKVELIRALASGKGRRILFTRTKFQTMKLAKDLTQHGIPAAELHGNLSQNQRDRNLRAFESGDVNVMVATDVAARGIDVSGVELVVQVDPPDDEKSFTHRSGRTARAGQSGDVVMIVLPDQRRKVRRLAKAAGIDTRFLRVEPNSDEVLELVGEIAEPVEGWTLDQSQPIRSNRSRGGHGGGHGAGRGQSRGRKRARDRAHEEARERKERRELQKKQERTGRDPQLAKERRRKRAQERLAASEAQKNGVNESRVERGERAERNDRRGERSERNERTARTMNRAERRNAQFSSHRDRRNGNGNGNGSRGAATEYTGAHHQGRKSAKKGNGSTSGGHRHSSNKHTTPFRSAKKHR